jgi:8-oxo-dGTP diphosphatase
MLKQSFFCREKPNKSKAFAIELTNMCFVHDDKRVLVHEKAGTKYPGGLIFPGGHVEEECSG